MKFDRSDVNIIIMVMVPVLLVEVQIVRDSARFIEPD
jgi:hypothetical protein